jgi:hypothetical protein
MGITAVGKAECAGLTGNTGSCTAFTYLAVGTTATAFDKARTTLYAETTGSGLARAAATVTRATTTDTNDTLQLVKAYSVTGTVTLAEEGTFNASSAGDMLQRTVLSPTRSVVNGDTYTLTVKIVHA